MSFQGNSEDIPTLEATNEAIDNMLFSPLKPDLDYVDATEAQAAMLRRLREQEDLIGRLMSALQKTQNGLLAAQKSVIRAHDRINTLEGERSPKSALILPDRLNS